MTIRWNCWASEKRYTGGTFCFSGNRLFQRLVEAHGFTAVAIENSFPRSRAVNEYAAGRGAASYEALQDTGFSYGFGRLAANRELVERIPLYNSDPSHRSRKGR